MAEIQLERIGRQELSIEIKGTAPLIVNRFDEKARQMMLDAQMGKTRTKKPPKDPEANFQASMYRLPDGGYGFPAAGFKAAIVGGARYFDGITMTSLKAGLFVIGAGPEQLVPLKCSEPEMREDAVRNTSGVADLRFRAQFTEWGATLRVLYIPLMLSAESVVALVDAGGFGGIGEWRPSAPKSYTGSYGTFAVVGE